MEQAIPRGLRLHQPPGSAEQPRLLQLLPAFRRDEQHIGRRLTRGLRIRCAAPQLRHQLCGAGLVALAQRQPQFGRDNLRIIRVDFIQPVERLRYQLIFMAGFADPHLLEQPVNRRHLRPHAGAAGQQQQRQ